MNYQELLHSPLIPFQIVPLIQKASYNIVTVLIQGEHGTGKELVAKIIHHIGEWKYYRFYKIDCKILAEDMAGDQFYRLLKEASDGMNPTTLYLKGVEYLRQTNQFILLELMSEGVLKNGFEKRIIKNLRFISSSSDDLKEKIAQRKFSEDLYNRLNTFLIYIPPLRERVKAIPKISQYILNEHSKKMKIKKLGISDNVMKLLESYWWPGNLTELEHVIIRSAIFSEGEDLVEKDLLFEIENEKSSFISFLKRAETKPVTLEEKSLLNGQSTDSLPLFLIELIHRIKNPLVSIKTFTQLLREKFNDVEFKEYFYRIVTEDIEKIDSLLNSLLNYIRINTPIQKTNTIHLILEEVLKKHENQLEERKIKIFKRFEKELPETIIHDEQLRYILNSILQYAIPTIPPNGSIGFLTKTFNIQRETVEQKSSIQKNERCVEVLIVFTGYKKPIEQFETVLGIPSIQEGKAVEFELRLVKEIIQKNRGMMKFEVNEKKPRTLISLRFPIERRRLVYYQSPPP
jgi:nitrogen-specific signal transduction histidine kinase